MIERLRMASILKETKKHISHELKENSDSTATSNEDNPFENAKKSNKKSSKNQFEANTSEASSIDLTENLEKSNTSDNEKSQTLNETKETNKRKRNEPPHYQHVSPSKTIPKKALLKNDAIKSTRTQPPTITMIVSRRETIVLDENESLTTSTRSNSPNATTIDLNENEAIPASSSLISSSPQSGRTSLSKVNSTYSVRGSPIVNNKNNSQPSSSLVLEEQIGNALKMCTSQLSFNRSGSVCSNQTFTYQPQIIPLSQHHYSNQMQPHSPLILPSNFNGTILYQPTIFLTANKKLSDLVNLQKSMEKYRQIVPKTASPTSSSSADTSSSELSKTSKKSDCVIKTKKS